MKVKIMKKMFFFLAIILFFIANLIFLADDYISFAQSGCCKQRRSTSGQWYNTGLSFNQCDNLNRQKDGDNIYDPVGRVWWDRNC
jgi:hypothetical protein